MTKVVDSPVQSALTSYFSGLKDLSEWSQCDRMRCERFETESAKHLLAGMMVLLEIGNRAAAVVDALGQAPHNLAERSKFCRVILMIGAQFDTLCVRHHSLFSRSTPRAC
jgi:hypothetical protein